MWGWLPGCWLSGPLNGSGPARGLALAEELGGRLVLWFPACVVGLGWLACLVFGVRDTPALLLLPALCGGGGWWVPPRALCVGVACCRVSGAVRPGCLTRVLLPCVGGGVWVWVGWL